jgi:hypothetical protein
MNAVAELFILLGMLSLTLFATLSMYHMRLYGYYIPFFAHLALLLATVSGLIENASIGRDMINLIISGAGTWAAWMVRKHIALEQSV